MEHIIFNLNLTSLLINLPVSVGRELNRSVCVWAGDRLNYKTTLGGPAVTVTLNCCYKQKTKDGATIKLHVHQNINVIFTSLKYS